MKFLDALTEAASSKSSSANGNERLLDLIPCSLSIGCGVQKRSESLHEVWASKCERGNTNKTNKSENEDITPFATTCDEDPNEAYEKHNKSICIRLCQEYSCSKTEDDKEWHETKFGILNF